MRRGKHLLFTPAIRAGLFAALALAAAFLPAGCAKAPKTYRVGILIGTDSMGGISDGFKKRMTELGYAEGKGISYDIRASNANRAEELKIAQEFVASGVDLVFAFPGQTALTVKKAAEGTKIPIVFANAIIGGTDLIDSVRNPGGNVTGVRIPNPELTVKSFDFLIEIAPATRRIMIIYDPGYVTDGPILDALRSAAAANGVAVRETEVPDAGKIVAVLNGLEKAGKADMDAVLFLPDTVPRSAEAGKAVIDFANRHRVPLIGGTRAMVTEGVLLTTTSDQGEHGALAANLANRIFKGAAAGSLPVLTTKTDLVVNYRKAKELGLDPPESLLKQASEIVR